VFFSAGIYVLKRKLRIHEDCSKQLILWNSLPTKQSNLASLIPLFSNLYRPSRAIPIIWFSNREIRRIRRSLRVLIRKTTPISVAIIVQVETFVVNTVGGISTILHDVVAVGSFAEGLGAREIVGFACYVL
jgi:hypothetical protein